MPVAVSWASTANGGSQRGLQVAVVASVIIAVIVVIYSVIQVRAGRWGHIDASTPGERNQLNLFLAFLLLGMASLLWTGSQPQSISVGLAIGGGLVVAAHVLRAWLKMSLHVAFAVYAASLLWPDWIAVAGTVALAVSVAWSRLVLRRHTVLEVITGFMAGCTAGLGFHFLAS